MIWECPSFATDIPSDKEDFASFIRENRLTPEVVAKAKEEMDARGIPEKQEGIDIKESKIEGLGAFIDQDVSQDTAIGPVLLDGQWTSLGRYANHAFFGNARPAVLDNGNILLIARCPLSAGHEITVNYREMRTAMLTIKTEAEVKSFVSN